VPKHTSLLQSTVYRASDVVKASIDQLGHAWGSLVAAGSDISMSEEADMSAFSSISLATSSSGGTADDTGLECCSVLQTASESDNFCDSSEINGNLGVSDRSVQSSYLFSTVFDDKENVIMLPFLSI